MSVSISVAGPVSLNRSVAESGLEINSGYDVTGIALQRTGKFADSSRAMTQDYGVTPQAVSTPTSLQIESTLSRQLYLSQSPSCTPQITGVVWPNKTIIFSGTIPPQNLSSGRNVVEVNYSTQVTIWPTAATTQPSADAVALYCVVSQGTSSLPCSNTQDGPTLIRASQDMNERPRKIMTSYSGYAEIDNIDSVGKDPVIVDIGVSTFFGARITACFGNLILRTR